MNILVRGERVALVGEDKREVWIDFKSSDSVCASRADVCLLMKSQLEKWKCHEKGQRTASSKNKI